MGTGWCHRNSTTIPRFLGDRRRRQLEPELNSQLGKGSSIILLCYSTLTAIGHHFSHIPIQDIFISEVFVSRSFSEFLYLEKWFTTSYLL